MAKAISLPTFFCAFLLIFFSQTGFAELTDGRLDYTRLSDAARKAGQLASYEHTPSAEGQIKTDRFRLEFAVPEQVRAYDVVPIRYKLNRPMENGRWAIIETAAYEDIKKAKGRSLYDLSVPGQIDVKIEYLGSISADYHEKYNIPLTPDGKSEISPFPPYKRDELVRSGEVRSAPLVWFKFRLTNTGDTILDPEGFAGSFAEPLLHKLDDGGNITATAATSNSFLRHLNYLYPGESAEFWANFLCTTDVQPGWYFGLKPGDYRLDFRMVCRFYNRYEWLTNIWSGTEFARLEVPFTVTEKGGAEPVETRFQNQSTANKIPSLYHKFEEFMTSFHTFPPALETEYEDTIYLQIAPWTSHITVKLILTDPMEIKVVRIPVKVSKETLEIKHNPDNVMVIKRNGEYEPVIAAQPMPGMRTGIVFGPYPEKHMYERLKEMKQLGVNLIINTSGDWHFHEMLGNTAYNPHAMSYKYFYDVLIPKLDMKLMGWSLYPPVNPFLFEVGKLLLDEDFEYSTTVKGYGGHLRTLDMGDPSVPRVIAAFTLFNYSRWGRHWYETKDGTVPIDLEDTWGWMRDDINVRYSLGPLAVAKFRDWLKEKYMTIERVNYAWGSDYDSFDEIDPEANQGVEGDGIDLGRLVFNRKDNVFTEWNAATEDWDVFRTILKMRIYSEANKLIRREIPKAEIALRSEGATPIAPGDKYSDNIHQRIIYYAQRRNGMVYDILREMDVLHFYSDYTTIPYDRYEWRKAMRQMVKAGIVPGYLPQFDHMRDMLLNEHYGREYQLHYNLDRPSKAIMVHCLTAAYPWWKATYEEGGMAAILWADYLCDGFATETQKKEIRLLSEHYKKLKK